MANCISCGRPLPAFSFGQRSDVCPQCRASAVDVQAPGSIAPPSAQLATTRKWPPVTTVLVGLNVAVFVAMALSGLSITEPTTEQLKLWGANWGPLSLGTQPWRILASNYLHIGIIHIAFNMWCLWDLGNLAERIFDRWTYVLAYTACGIAGSLASLWWHPFVVGAGASGAIFGLAGALMAALYLGNLPIPKQAMRQTLRSLVIFAIYNLGFGAVGGNIDNSAHIGGLLCGLALGAILAKRLTSPLEERASWRLGVFAVTAIVLVAAFTGVRRANAYVVPLGLGAEALEKGQMDAAVRDLDQALVARPNDPEVLGLSGQAYFLKKDYPRALDLLQRAVQADPNDPDTQYDLGAALLQTGNPAAALAPLQKATEMDPKSAAAMKALAQAYLVQGMTAQAQEAFAKAQQLAQQQK